MVACTVRLPDNLGLTVSELLDKYPYIAPEWEDVVHDMMANAVEKIIDEIRSKAGVEADQRLLAGQPQCEDSARPSSSRPHEENRRCRCRLTKVTFVV
jgi:hypothetical protein